LAIALVATAPVILLVTLWIVLRGYRRIKPAVVAASGRACVGCVQHLNGLGNSGTCPECGRVLDLAADQRSWSRARMFR